jgi:tRNA dimethylallyltransferase
MQKVIAIVGPTASGKSALGVFLAQKLGGEVISADSRQVYTGLSIGTGKVTKKEMGGIPHHLLDVASPKKQFSASDFERLATEAIKKIASKGKIPVVVGGTGFYADALLGRLTLPDVPPNQALREKLEMKTAEELFAMLKKKDPRRAATIEPEHKRRLIRALEIAEALGKNPEPKAHDSYDVLWIGIAADEKTLKRKIHVRLLARMKAGMLAETKKLHKAGLSFKRMKKLGLEYRSLAELLLGEVTKEEMFEGLESAINDYAKRQMRWFKRNPDIHWISKKSEALTLAKAFISGYYIPR